jgi:PBP1b-binding outer membrane lipoprotein LpoB
VKIALATIAACLLVGCSSPKIEYRPVPAHIIPLAPDLPKIKSDDLSCLSDDTYTKLATRDRLNQQYAEELRALLEVKP